MRLSQESAYALRGLTELARHPHGAVVDVGRLAATAGLPRPFLAKIFSRLALNGVVNAYRGRSRGYGLARPAAEISVRAVLEAVEGPHFFERCVFFGTTCSEQKPCQLHPLWSEIRPRLVARVESTSIHDLLLDEWAREIVPTGSGR